jgi:hypothetical protein
VENATETQTFDGVLQVSWTIFRSPEHELGRGLITWNLARDISLPHRKGGNVEKEKKKRRKHKALP